MTGSNGDQYVYDGLDQGVAKIGGANASEVLYFGGKMIGLRSAATGGYTDLIWAGNTMVAMVAGAQSGSPYYRQVDHEGTLALMTDASGQVIATNLDSPYGQVIASNAADPLPYAQLTYDNNGTLHAWYRNYELAQGRWLTPDPYNGSYDLMNPQSFNRYMYVNGNPLGFVDPSGEAGGIAGWGGACSLLHYSGNLPTTEIDGNSFNFCNPLPYAATYGAVYAGSGLYDLFSGTSWSWSDTTTNAGIVASDVVPWIGAALTIACSVNDFNSSVCGPSGWTSAVFTGKNAWVGKGVNDISAVVGAYLCTVGGGPESPGCIGYVIYSVANALFSWAWDLWGPPQFTGSLLPRPSDLGGLGSSPIGIPNRNVSLQQLLGQSLTGSVPSPATSRQ